MIEQDSTDNVYERFVEYRIKYPSLTLSDLVEFFPGHNVVDLNEDPKVKKAIAEIKKAELDEAIELKAERQFIEMRRLDKRDTLKERAMEILEHRLYSNDEDKRWSAAKELLRGDSIRDAKLSEIKAEFEARRGKEEESYPDPSGADANME